MADKTSKKEVKPADKKVGDLLEKHPVVQNTARGLFRNENGTTIVQERVPRGDLPQDEVIMPRNEWDLTEDDLKGLAEHAKKSIDPILAKYDEDVAHEDAVARAVSTKDGGKYQGRVSACTQKLILDSMKGSTKKTENKTEKKATEQEANIDSLVNAIPTSMADVGSTPKKTTQSKPPKDAADAGGELATAKKMREKGYKYVVQFTDGGKDAGEPMYFKSSGEVGPFMRGQPTWKMKWTKDVDKYIAELESKDTSVSSKPPKEAGMDKEMLRREANDLCKKLNALKVLLSDDKDEKEDEEKNETPSEETNDKDAGSKKGPGIPDGTGPKAGTPECQKSDAVPEEACDKTVLASLDEIAGMVEKEARDKNDMDLFRIAYQIDCVSDYLSGAKDASTLQQDPDEDYMRKAFKSGVNEHDADENYMKEFNNDNTKETSRVVGNVSVQHKQASELPYRVKKDA